MRESEKHEEVSLTELRDELVKKDKGNGYVKDELCFFMPTGYRFTEMGNTVEAAGPGGD